MTKDQSQLSWWWFKQPVCRFNIYVSVAVLRNSPKRPFIKVEREVYNPVSSTKCYSPSFTQLPPSYRTCSFISHLNFPGSIQHDAIFSTQNQWPTQAFPVLPGVHLLLGQENAQVDKVPCPTAQYHSTSPASNSKMWSQVMYTTTMPHILLIHKPSLKLDDTQLKSPTSQTFAESPMASATFST